MLLSVNGGIVTCARSADLFANGSEAVSIFDSGAGIGTLFRPILSFRFPSGVRAPHAVRAVRAFQAVIALLAFYAGSAVALTFVRIEKSSCRVRPAICGAVGQRDGHCRIHAVRARYRP